MTNFIPAKTGGFFCLKLMNTKTNHYKEPKLSTYPSDKMSVQPQSMDKNITDQITDLAKNLITAHSTADDAEGRADALALVKKELFEYPMEEFASGGYHSVLIRNTVNETRKFKIILNAHLDVMPGSITQFEPYEKDGKLYGRGSYDMKATTAAMVLLFRYLAKHLPYPIALQVTTDEEITGKHGTKYQLEKGVRSDFVITGECGSDFRIVNKAKGILWFKLHTTGTKAHGAYPWKGDNALWKLQQAVTEIHTLFPVPEKEAWVTTMNLAKIETANNAFNHVPDSATASIDIRFTADDEKDLIKRIKEVISPDMHMEVITHESPEDIADDDPFLLSLEKAITETTGTQAKRVSAHAPSDIRHFNTVGCHGVEFGTIGSGQHADEEWVDIKSLEKYFSVLETFLIDAIKI